mgnify:CR=1 FL=1|tara:strand:+ start:188 stop:1159 length:972 start_codon:yes stop_codon:yes gene_type:complete
MTKVEVIIFTFNRALQLDACIENVFKNFPHKSSKVHVVYQWSKKHQKSYKILIKKWKKQNVIFYKRNEKANFFKNKFKYFFRPLNLLWFLRWPIMFKDNANFKELLEKIILNSKNKYITFVPDDQIFYRKTTVPQKVFDILNKKKNYFYRMFTGIHFKDEHKFNNNIKFKQYSDKGIKFIEWFLKDKLADHSWKYNFTIEGTIYSKKDLLKFLKPFYYHNPITLEAIGLWESRFRNFFSFGLSSNKRTTAGYQINNVQKLVDTPHSNFNPELLQKAYLDNYRLHIKKNDFVDEYFNILPEKIYLYKKNKRVTIKNYSKNLRTS